MKYSHLLICLELTGLSPERLAPYFNVSNMTLRRWKLKPRQSIEKAEMETIKQGVHSLISDRLLSEEDPRVLRLVENQASSYIQSVINYLGIDSNFFHKPKSKEDAVLSLGKIGSSEERQEKVLHKNAEIKSHFKNGSVWKEQLSFLLKIVKSKTLNKPQKFVAYGALFYLITPFDFIPDHIPVFGLLDDFALIGIAVAYYQSKLFEKKC